ncbi:mycothiol system anti-sigma-R factor [Actinokineospora auranticolor]|uniref:Mycothiol system anti-sigma-R factor n=1 Tax=Actinokineospora auranticolor TaxID=155976 RepID=A0A2S6GX83_9PSEU|nr:mycothiol system anti-sigma-R factor [Actinokineospora auranticolor]PPK69852.1 mycothiol system anti-sigma-R factor [Actinokineospora auranticolor]
MSCEGNHETDCSDVLAEVWSFLDRECDVDRRVALQRHLDECSPCLEQYGLEEHLKLLLARKCGGDQAPDEFRERLRASIRQTVIQHRGVEIELTRATVERGEN